MPRQALQPVFIGWDARRRSMNRPPRSRIETSVRAEHVIIVLRRARNPLSEMRHRGGIR
jgi:hypothetical protein